MFCPVCKSEYRFGFTECSDCGVPLVERLDDASSPPNEPVNPDLAEQLWTGADSNDCDLICNALDEAKIPYRKFSREAEPLPGLSLPTFTILIHTRNREAGHAVLEDLQRQFESAQTLSQQTAAARPSSSALDLEDDAGEASDSARDFVPEDFNPEDATAEVWSGADPAMAEALQASLRENGIGCAIAQDAETTRVAVVPANEPRAREIVREVVDGTPMQ